MDLDAMLKDLREQRDAVIEAIQALERVAYLAAGKRGRPPQSVTEPASTPRKRRAFSAETRAKMAAAQKKRWAAKRKG